MGQGPSKQEIEEAEKRKRREERRQELEEKKLVLDKETKITELNSHREIELAKIEDRNRERKDKLEETKCKLESARQMAAMSLLGKTLAKEGDFDRSYTLAFGQLLHSLGTNTTLNHDSFQKSADNVPKALPPNIEHVVESVMSRVNTEDAEIVDEDGLFGNLAAEVVS